jgi:plastocyanin
MRQKMIGLLIGIYLVGLIALGGMGVAIAAMHHGYSTPSPSVPGVTHIFIRNDVYSPANVQIVPGTTITWTNQDTVPHAVVVSDTVTATNDMWTSGSLATGQSASYTFTSPGRFPYHCSLHSGMGGVVIVM